MKHYFESILLVTFLVLTGVVDSKADALIATVPTGLGPTALAIDSVTNKIYIVNGQAGTVTVLDGATDSTSTIAVGSYSSPYAIAVNPVTNTIYVADVGDSSVTVIDGATNHTSTVKIGGGTSPAPIALAVNSLTNKVYVANRCNPGANTTEIDGNSDSTTSIPSVISNNIGLNSTTNNIYVSSQVNDAITVINGANNSTATITLATTAGAFAINPVTNVIYAASSYSYDSLVVVINGATNTVTKYITTGLNTEPNALAINTATNKVYVGNVGGEPSIGGNIITVIDGATNNTTAISLGINSTNYPSESYQAIAINQVTNKIYVANQGSGVSIINGANNSVTTLNLASPFAIAVNSLTNKIYVTNWNNSEVYVINGNNTSINSVHFKYKTSVIGFDGVLAVYSLNGRQILRVSFSKSSTKESILHLSNKTMATGVYKYCFLKDQKVMDYGTFFVR